MVRLLLTRVSFRTATSEGNGEISCATQKNHDLNGLNDFSTLMSFPIEIPLNEWWATSRHLHQRRSNGTWKMEKLFTFPLDSLQWCACDIERKALRICLCGYLFIQHPTWLGWKIPPWKSIQWNEWKIVYIGLRGFCWAKPLKGCLTDHVGFPEKNYRLKLDFQENFHLLEPFVGARKLTKHKRFEYRITWAKARRRFPRRSNFRRFVCPTWTGASDSCRPPEGRNMKSRSAS